MDKEFWNNLSLKLEKFLSNSDVDSNGNVNHVIKKAFVARINDLTCNLLTNDHAPFHFHIKSTQRKINVRIIINTLEPYPGDKISPEDLKKIKYFFQHAPNTYSKLKEMAKRFYPDYIPN